MGSCLGSHSDLADCTTYPAYHRSGPRISSRTAAIPPEEEEPLPVYSTLHETIFQGTLLESDGKPRPRNPWAAIGSLLLQSLALVALIVIPLYHPDVLPKRERLTMLYLPPAAAAAPSGSTRLRTPTFKHTPTSTSITSPILNTPEAPPTPAAPNGGVVGGVPGGVVGGVPGGVLGEMLGSAHTMPVLSKTTEPTRTKKVRIASTVAAANLVHDVAPTYPPEAGRARIEGTVVLLAAIGKDGTVQDVRVESGLPVLAQAAIDAVKQWRYRPYLLNGEPVEVDSRVIINFTLSAS
jgi:protein TonB